MEIYRTDDMTYGVMAAATAAACFSVLAASSSVANEPVHPPLTHDDDHDGHAVLWRLLYLEPNDFVEVSP